jgi:hypothetical protein
VLKFQNAPRFRNHMVVEAPMLVLVQFKKFIGCLINMNIEVLRAVFLLCVFLNIVSYSESSLAVPWSRQPSLVVFVKLLYSVYVCVRCTASVLICHSVLLHASFLFDQAEAVK